MTLLSCQGEPNVALIQAMDAGTPLAEPSRSLKLSLNMSTTDRSTTPARPSTWHHARSAAERSASSSRATSGVVRRPGHRSSFFIVPQGDIGPVVEQQLQRLEPGV